MVRIVGFYITL